MVSIVKSASCSSSKPTVPGMNRRLALTGGRVLPASSEPATLSNFALNPLLAGKQRFLVAQASLTFAGSGVITFDSPGRGMGSTTGSAEYEAVVVSFVGDVVVFRFRRDSLVPREHLPWPIRVAVPGIVVGGDEVEEFVRRKPRASAVNHPVTVGADQDQVAQSCPSRTGGM